MQEHSIAVHTMFGPVRSRAAPASEPRLMSVGMGEEEDVVARAGCHRPLHSSSVVLELGTKSGKQVAPPSCCANRASAARTSKLAMEVETADQTYKMSDSPSASVVYHTIHETSSVHGRLKERTLERTSFWSSKASMIVVTAVASN
jgi:hypothetical protein